MHFTRDRSYFFPKIKSWIRLSEEWPKLKSINDNIALLNLKQLFKKKSHIWLLQFIRNFFVNYLLFHSITVSIWSLIFGDNY